MTGADWNGRYFVIGIALLLVLAAGFGLVRNALFGAPAQVAAAPVPEDNSMLFGLACQKAITAQLRAPGSAQFESPWPVQGNQADGYAMKSYVDAQNSFGATLRQNFICTAPPGTLNISAVLLN
jgi:hypothetical protein